MEVKLFSFIGIFLVFVVVLASFAIPNKTVYEASEELVELVVETEESSQALLPSIEPLPAYEIGLFREEGRVQLRFSATHVNKGDGPLEIASTPITGSESEEREVVQRIYNRDDTTDTEVIGKFLWHAPHNRYHFTDYMSYELRSLDLPGTPLIFEDKVTYCIRDNDKIEGEHPNAPEERTYIRCNPELQGVSVGWSGTYGYHLPGQNFDVTDLPAGRYEIVLIFDPLDNIAEIDEDDNVSRQAIYLDPGNMVVRVE